MQSLWEVLGYDELATEVAESLRESSDITVVEGPPGVGKSFLAQGIGELWESGVFTIESLTAETMVLRRSSDGSELTLKKTIK